MTDLVPAALNWVWQGSVLTIAVALGLRVCPRASAATRERVWWTALAAVMALGVVALTDDPLLPSEAIARPAAPVLIPDVLWGTLGLAVLGAAWVAAGLVRIGLGLAHVRRARREAGPFPATREARLPLWNRLRDRGVPLVVSSNVGHAAVLGIRRPVIAISPGTITRLTDDELDQVVLHEYAHVQRRDPLGLLVQRLAGAIAGFHPAVWWLDRAIALNREIACDDWVLAMSARPKTYGACLLKLATAGAPGGPRLAPGAGVRRHQLAVRIASLLDPSRRRAIRGSWLAVSVAVPLVLALSAWCSAHELVAHPRAIVTIADIRDLALALGTPFDLPVLASPAPIVTVRTNGARPSQVAPVAMPVTLSAPLDASVLEWFAIETPPTPFDRHPPSVPETSTPPVLVREPSLAPHTAEPAPIARSAEASQPAVADGPVTPWQAIATAGTSVGTGTWKAGVSTGRAFSRLGRSVAGVF